MYIGVGFERRLVCQQKNDSEEHDPHSPRPPKQRSLRFVFLEISITHLSRRDCVLLCIIVLFIFILFYFIYLFYDMF